MKPCILKAKRKIYKHIETIVFHFKKRWHIIESEEQRKRNLTRGIDLSSLYPKFDDFYKNRIKKN